MTKEEILKMEAGPEIDALFTEKVMGWKKGCDGKTIPFFTALRGQPVFVYRKNRIGNNFKPSTNISHAMEGVEKVKHKTSIHICINGEENDCLVNSIICSDSQLELAITRALILWAMEKEATND